MTKVNYRKLVAFVQMIYLSLLKEQCPCHSCMNIMHAKSRVSLIALMSPSCLRHDK